MISAHQIESSKVVKELTESKLLWNRFRGDSNSLGENQGSALTPSANNPSGKDSVLNPHSNGLLTAYEKKESLANDKSMDTATTSLGGDTALSQTKESAAKSDKATNAQRIAAPDTHVQNAILDIDAAKIIKDFENPSISVENSSSDPKIVMTMSVST